MTWIDLILFCLVLQYLIDCDLSCLINWFWLMLIDEDTSYRFEWVNNLVPTFVVCLSSLFFFMFGFVFFDFLCVSLILIHLNRCWLSLSMLIYLTNLCLSLFIHLDGLLLTCIYDDYLSSIPTALFDFYSFWLPRSDLCCLSWMDVD